MRTLKTIMFYILLVVGMLSAEAQQVLIDQGVSANGLMCFPIHNKENTYLYLPQRARLSLQNDSIPEFSFLRYVLEKPTENSSKSITEADGGGILNFLVLYDTPEDAIRKAERVLKQKMENDSIKLQGPVIFERGKYTLVSSIVNSKSGKNEKKIIGSGSAPILENSKIPLSFQLDPVKSKLLLESFKMATPDISLLFELSFSGLTDNYEAELEVDWSEVKKSHAFDAGGSIYFVGVDVSLGFDKLRKDQAIKLTSTGSDESMESLVETVYSKLLELMFEPVEASEVPEDQRGGLQDALGSLIGQNGTMGSSNTTGFGINVGYQYKEHRTTGKSNMTFNGRSAVSRNHYITFNAGDLYKKFGKNKRVFKDVPLWDPVFQQRDVHVGVDGNLEKEFDRMLNSVTVKLRKNHQNGDQTSKEVLLTKNTYADANGKISMKYLNHDDAEREKWLDYEYQTIWKFIGGGSYSENWKKESAAMINLYTPFKRRKIELSGDYSVLVREQVRAVSVKIAYDFFEDQRTDMKTIYPNRKTNGDFFEITLPKDTEEVQYSVTWFLKDGSVKKYEGVDKYGLIFIDELPKL